MGFLNNPFPSFCALIWCVWLDDAVRVQDGVVGSLDGREVLVRGWLQNKRSGGGIVFLFIRDGSGVVQCTVRKGEVDAKVFDLFLSTRVESSVQIEGEVKPDPRAVGGREIIVHSGKVDSAALEEFPIAKQFQGPDFLLDKRHLFVRSDKMRAVLKVRAVILSAARSWLDSHDYLEVHGPTLTSAALDGGSTLFEVKYFDEKAYLTQICQLYAQALIAAVGNIYTISPSFSPEKSPPPILPTQYCNLEPHAPYINLV